jgi:hypothetical protein
MNTLETLLEQVANINMEYAKIEEASKDSFNIFTVLRGESEEVGLHSKFIAELLDPNGSHRLGRLFQALFIKMLIKNNFTIDDSPFSVQSEAVLGDSGRIDILLEGKNQVLIIENKIYAKDQPKQLQRYYEALRNRYSDDKIRIIYLTLDGGSPSDESQGTLPSERIWNISYKTNILEWIVLCIEEENNTTRLREILIQYKNLVKNLTGQSMSAKQKAEIKQLLLSGNNLEAAISIEKTIDDAKIEVQKLVWRELIDSLKEKGFDFNFVKTDLSPSDPKICGNYYNRQNPSRLYGIERKVWEADGYAIHFYIEVNWCLYYGFALAQNNKRITGDRLTNAVNQSLKATIATLPCNWATSADPDSEDWVAWRYTKEKVDFRNFSNENTIRLGNPDFRKKWIAETTDEIVEVIKSFRKAAANLE